MQVSHRNSSTDDPMFEKALSKAVKQCNVREPYYMQVSTADDSKSDKVTYLIIINFTKTITTQPLL